MPKIRHIALNPQKCRKFVTKGINLNFKNPIASFPDNLEPEFMMRINTALIEGKIVELGDDGTNFQIPGQAGFNFQSEHDDETAEVVGKKIVKEVVDEDGNIKKVHVIQFFGETEDENKDIEPKLILPTIIGKIDDEHED